MEQFFDVARLHSQVRRSLLDQPRENQLSVARWLKLLNQQDLPAMELLIKMDSGKIEFKEAMEMLDNRSEQSPY